MIYALRTRHRWMTGCLFLGALVGLAAGLMVRNPVPEMDAIPGEVPLSFSEFSDGFWPDLPISIGHDLDSSGSEVMILRPQKVLPFPDVLIYWQPGAQTVRIDEQAVLLGSLSGTLATRIVLPEKEGKLVLYSLAHGDILSSLTVASGRAVSAPSGEVQ
ncbi:MAG: hypothetical protein O3B73_17680 [bacterium]|jgi:hypothetical protein|nr:hypothetical protein [bacterium]